MQNLQDIQEKIFFEAKNILDILSKITSKEELLAKQDLFAEVTDRIAFLRILEKNKDSFTTEEEFQHISLQDFPADSSSDLTESFENAALDQGTIEEEVIFTTEINDISNDETPEEKNMEDFLEMETAYDQVVKEHLTDIELEPTEKEEKKVEPPKSPEIPQVVPNENDENERVSQKEKEFLDAEERRRKIVEFSKEDIPHPISTEPFQEEKIPETASEKKFKLAHIKGLKAMQNLFDEDPLEKIQEKEAAKPAASPHSGSLLKTNISTEFMEAPKKQPEFRLDFNDKVAFTKLLFRGDEKELKLTIDRLNSFDNVEDARKYLSDVYYQKDWSKVDEYAQRLWDLVENKFL